jgi:mannose-6-phosphate isomerase-like protein (cupin superfamily)
MNVKCAVVLMWLSGVWLAGASGADRTPARAGERPEMRGCVTDAAELPEEKFAWGTLTWVCNAKLSPGAKQTVGIATILPGQKNPVHFHPNCEEVLYMISGCGQHSFDGGVVALKAGMTIRIPAGVRHNLANTGAEPIKCLISFSSGDRRTVFLDEKPPR